MNWIFWDNVNYIARKYGRRKYVAVYNSHIICSDDNKSRLSRRTKSKIKEPVLIMNVGDYNTEGFVAKVALEDMIRGLGQAMKKR